MVRARHHNGTYSVYDDFREAYWWLRDETPRDSRVMAWWDYGCQDTSETPLRHFLHHAMTPHCLPPVSTSAPLLTHLHTRPRDAATRPQVPDQRRRQPHNSRRRQHLEPRAHRLGGQVPRLERGGVARDHAPPR